MIDFIHAGVDQVWTGLKWSPHMIGRRAPEKRPQRRIFRAPGGRLKIFSTNFCESEANVRREET